MTVLVLRALGLGDALTGIPALRGLRRAFPRHELTLAAAPGIGGWLQRLGIVDRVVPAQGLTAPLPVTGPEIAVNLHGRGPQSNRLLLATEPGRLIAFRDDVESHLDGPHWSEAEHEVDRWCRLVQDAGGRCDRFDLRLPTTGDREGYVVVHPGAASASRRWPAERWAAVIDHLTGLGRSVVITGGPAERRLCAAVSRRSGSAQDLSGSLSLDDLADLVARAGLLICGDTGVAHLATAFGTPSVLLFGPTAPQLWGPAIDPAQHLVLWHGDRPGDPHGESLDPALARITVSEVVSAVDAAVRTSMKIS